MAQGRNRKQRRRRRRKRRRNGSHAHSIDASSFYTPSIVQFSFEEEAGRNLRFETFSGDREVNFEGYERAEH